VYPLKLCTSSTFAHNSILLRQKFDVTDETATNRARKTGMPQIARRRRGPGCIKRIARKGQAPGGGEREEDIDRLLYPDRGDDQEWGPAELEKGSFTDTVVVSGEEWGGRSKVLVVGGLVVIGLVCLKILVIHTHTTCTHNTQNKHTLISFY